MTVKRYVVRRSTATAQKNTSECNSSSKNSGTSGKRKVSRGTSKASQDITEKPRVDRGPFSVKEFRNGGRAVVRFFITQTSGTRNLRPWRGENDWKPWYVVDAETWSPAEGTKTEGYRSETEARRVAREYREEYGPYARSPF